MTLIHKFAKKLRSLREQYELTQEELADKSDLSVTYITQLESAQKLPSLDTLSKLAHGLRVPIMTLVEFDEPDDKRGREIQLVVQRLEACELGMLRRIRRSIDCLVG